MSFRLVPAPPAVSVFAVSSHDIQVTWRGGLDEIALEAPGGVRSTNPSQLAGCVTFDGLEPGTAHTVLISRRGRQKRIEAHTLQRPPGELLVRIATMNDLHLGLDTFGLTGRIVEAGSALRCAQSAAAAATAWGADRFVLKGDLVDGSDDREWEQLTGLIASIGVPVDTLLGNHESRHGPSAEARRKLDAIAGHGPERARRVDLPGIDLVLVDTTSNDRHTADPEAILTHVPKVLRPGQPTLLTHHHQIHPAPLMNTYPRGAHGRRADNLLRAVAATNPDSVLASGHTHRHRRSVQHGLTVTELGSTKDYPGTWCGYRIHEGGIEATVYRIADPVAVEWLDRTGAAVSGVWARWSPGGLDDRCFSLAWGGPGRS